MLPPTRRAHSCPADLADSGARATRVGGIVVRDVQAVVLDDRALSGTLVGMSFLKGLRRFQVENGRLLLEQ